MENAHGFVYSHHLNTYRKSKSERVEEKVIERAEN
jgi:hypothetical protein